MSKMRPLPSHIRLHRRFTKEPLVAAASPDEVTTRIKEVGNILASIRIIPTDGMLQTVQSSIVELQVTVTFDGIKIPVEAEVEWLYIESE